MASKQTYECFVCKRNGHPGTNVYLSGKDEQGKTIYKNPDMSPHQHMKAAAVTYQEQQQDSSTTITTEPTSLKIINAKLDRIISLLESQKR